MLVKEVGEIAPRDVKLVGRSKRLIAAKFVILVDIFEILSVHRIKIEQKINIFSFPRSRIGELVGNGYSQSKENL